MMIQKVFNLLRRRKAKKPLLIGSQNASFSNNFVVPQLSSSIFLKKRSNFFIINLLSSIFRTKKAKTGFGDSISIIGLHGWFPTKMLQTVIGAPRGTSEKLCNMMGQVLDEYLSSLSSLPSVPSPPSSSKSKKITKMPLEGNGLIGERVTMHYNTLVDKGYIETLGSSDTIIFTVHSQGGPVGVLLAEKLLKLGIIDPKRQKIAFCSLAGVYHGPWEDLKENVVIKWIEADAARELFDLIPGGGVGSLSKKIDSALTLLLKNNFIICNIGSWMDAVVPIRSSLMLQHQSPLIWRSVYIDSHNWEGNFLNNFISFIILLINLQIREALPVMANMSEGLSGSVIESNSHSTIYDDKRVYKTLLEWMVHLDSGSGAGGGGGLSFNRDDDLGRKGYHSRSLLDFDNSHWLPWSLHSLLGNQEFIKKIKADPSLSILFYEELPKLWLEWTPKEVKFKLLKKQIEPFMKSVMNGKL